MSNKIDHAILTDISLELSNAVNFSKAKYHERLAVKLYDPKTAAETHWSILKIFLNNSKIPLIPLLLTTALLDKTNLFNDCFREQCRPIINESSLPNNQMLGTVANNQMFARLSNFNMDTDSITKLIHLLDPNKAHRWNGYPIGVIKLCAMSVPKPLHILSNNSVMNECFPSEWKKANIIPVHKRWQKIVKKHRPVSILRICSRIFEKKICLMLFLLLTCNQSGFQPGDLSVHQLLSTTLRIYKSFDANPSHQVRGVFLYI